MAVLANAGLTVTLRRSRGADIDAACGQLAARPATLATAPESSVASG
jgi:adenine C2-methylase RlmN of 23S rRNA A2503 and tRNA A37